MRAERRSPNLLLTVVVPAYNEAATVEIALRRIREVALRLEVIAVNDASTDGTRSEEHTSELQSLAYLVCRLLLEKKKKPIDTLYHGASILTTIDKSNPTMTVEDVRNIDLH